MKNISLLKKNYIYNLIYQVLAIIIPFITTPYISRSLGVTAIGDFSYTSGIVTYFGLIAATGTVSFGNREIAIRHNNIEERSILFWEIIIFRLFTCFLAIVAYIVFVFSSLTEYRMMFIIQFFTVFSWVIDVSWYCQGMENFKITAFRNTIVKILATAAIFLFVRKPEDVLIYTFINSCASFLGNFTMWGYVMKTVKLVPFFKIHCFRHTKGIFQLFIPVIALQVYTVLDKTMLGVFVNTTEVGYYTQADKIIQMATTVISSLTTVLLPRISNLARDNDMRELRGLLSKSLNFIFALAFPMCVGCILIIDQFVPIFFGYGYEPVTNIIRVQSILFVVVNLGRLLGTTLVALGQQTNYTAAVIFAALLNFGLNSLMLLVFHKGAIGVSIASVMAELSAAILQMIFVRKLITIKMIFRSFSAYLFAAIIMGIAICILRLVIGTGILPMITEMLIGCLVYFLILIIRKDDLLLNIFNGVRKKRS